MLMRDDDGWDDFRDEWFDDEDGIPFGMAECPLCGNIWPEDHMDTDSGDCVTCEEMRHWVEGDEDEDAQD